MSRVMQRTVAFYVLRLRSRETASYRSLCDVNWTEQLSVFANRPWEEKEFSGVRYDSILDREYPVLSILEQFDSTFVQYIDSKNKCVTDYMDSYLENGRGDLAKSSAFAFFSQYGLVGRISGSAGKSTAPLKRALDHYWAPGNNWEWDILPVVMTDSLERFEKELRELSSLSAGFTTTNGLFSDSHHVDKIGEFYQEMADSIGTELSVEIKISIPRGNRFSSAARSFKQVVKDFVPYAAGQGKLMQVTGTDLSDKLLELNLVSHPLVEREEIEIRDNEPRQFTNLIDRLVSVCQDKESYLYDILQEV